jgi:tRNA pseudouridine38-40 synthase
LDVDAMNEAASVLHGVHDFAPLAGTVSPDRTTVRDMRLWRIWRDGDHVLMETTANGFLPHQIRRTGAVLLEIGLGRLEPETLQGILAGETAVPAWCAVLPAKGLCLMSVEYNDFPLESKGT